MIYFVTLPKYFLSLKWNLFASRLNAKCPTFISWKPQPGAWAIDAFTISWRHISFYAFPPFRIIGKVLAKIQKDEARGAPDSSLLVHSTMVSTNAGPSGRSPPANSTLQRPVTHSRKDIHASSTSSEADTFGHTFIGQTLRSSGLSEDSLQLIRTVLETFHQTSIQLSSTTLAIILH